MCYGSGTHLELLSKKIKMKLKFSCVVDNQPIFKAQAYILVNSLLQLAKIDAKNIYIHTVEKVDDEFYTWLTSLGVNIIQINPFSIENPYCNKLQQLKTFQNLEEYDYVMLLDCDIAVFNLEELDLKEEVYAKIVDFPNPPLTILQDIYKAANLNFAECESSFSIDNENVTYCNNCNGGVYILSKKALNEIAPKWIDYAQWSIDNKKLFTDKYAKHADQVGFALALSSLNKKATHLSIEWNFPTHVKKELLPNIKPNIIHFHNCINEHMQIKKVGLKNVDEQIDTINEIISEKIIDSLNNSLFWDLRYALYPELGNRDVSVIVATKHQNLHKRDILSEDLNEAFAEVKRPDLLQYLVDVSRFNFGFFTSHYPRVFEYTWLLAQLENEKNGTVLDIGAGVCPLPICLNEQGLQVTTVDSHPKKRILKDRDEWNEWGFLDYAIFDKKIKSYNSDFLKYKTTDLFDYIYSISVIEHIPSKGRIQLIKKVAKLLKKGGKLLLTIDLIPNTNNLWNFSEDKEVESTAEHGSIESFKKELSSSGFEVLEEEIQRNIKDSRTDVYYVKAILRKKNILANLFNI